MIEWRIRKGRMYYSARECWQLLKRDNWKMKHQGIKYLFCDFYWVIILSFLSITSQATILHTHKYQQSPYLISIQQNPPQIVKKKHKKNKVLLTKINPNTHNLSAYRQNTWAQLKPQLDSLQTQFKLCHY